MRVLRFVLPTFGSVGRLVRRSGGARALVVATISGALLATSLAPASAAVPGAARSVTPASPVAPVKTRTPSSATGTKSASRSKTSPGDRKDVALNGWGDNLGYHLAVSTAAGSWAWREIALLRPARIDDSTWYGYQCASGDGRYAAVTVLPGSAVDNAAARDHGAVGYSVDLTTGRVRPVASGIGFKYHSPGCGVSDIAEFTLNPGSDQASTVVLTTDLSTGRVTRRTTVAGQVTSVVPSTGGPVGVMGSGLVRLPVSGKPVTLAAADGAAFDLRPTADGGVAFLSMHEGARSLRVAKVRGGKMTVLGSGPTTTQLFQGRVGHPVVVGAATLNPGSGLVRVPGTRVPGGASASSLSGRAVLGTATGSAVPDRARSDRTVVDAAAAAAQAAPPVVDTTSSSVLTRAAPTTDAAATTTLPKLVTAQGLVTPKVAAAAGTPKCAVPRLAENRQVMQPWPSQIDWASQMAEQGLLGSSVGRPANYANMGLAAYAANTDFSRVALSHPAGDSFDSVPRSVYQAIMAQESNWSQASWHALPGIAGGPLISDYYGAAGGITSINYAGADCGYGIGQVTTGMAATDTTYSANGKAKIAVDYEENIAAGLQILEKTWNQLYAAGITANGGSPRYLENWYFAAWAYNTGIQPNAANGNTTGCTPGPTCTGADGTWGLGWTNNPKNSDYPPNRAAYLKLTYADAAHPGLWPYQERILGWMGSPLIRLSHAAYATPTYNGGSTWLQVPAADLFCTVAGNKCDPTYVAADPSKSYCTLASRACWWHGPVTWVPSCSTTCATSPYTVGSGSTEPAPGASPHPPTCSLDTSKVPASSIIVDESQSQPPLNLVGCPSSPNWSQGGTFTYSYGQNAAGDDIGAIDTHQIGAGFGGHILFTHTENGADQSVVNTGKWTPTLPSLQYYKVKLHLPATGASATDVVYNIYPGGGVSPWKIRVNQHWGTEEWVTIGTFAMQNGGYVTLSNTSSDTAYGDSAYSNYDVAYDAIAFVQMGGSPGHPIGGPPRVIDAPKGSNPAWVQCGCVRRTAGDPVDTSTGYFGDSFTDLDVPGRSMPLSFRRTYASALASPSGPNSAIAVNGAFGYGWTYSYNLATVTNGTTGDVTVKQEDGSQVDFTNASGTYTPTLLRNNATLVKSGTTYVYTRRGRQVFVFDVATGHLTSESDLAGRRATPAYTTTLAYDTSGHLSTVTDPANRKFTLTWTGSHITALTDTAGRQVTYGYDTSNNLTDVYGAGTTRSPSLLNDDHFVYTYTAAHLMASMRAPNAYGITTTPLPVTTMVYDASERVTKQTDPLGRATIFTYGPDTTAGLVAGQTQVTDPVGHKTVYTYADGLLTSEKRGVGTSDAGTWTYTYDPVTLGVSTSTDPSGGVQTFTYDDQGNKTSASDPRGYTTSYTYDALGDMTSMIDPEGVKTTYGYDEAGHIATSATTTNDGTATYGQATSTRQQAIGQSAEVPDGNPPTATVHTTNAYYDDPAHPGDLSRTVDARGFTTTRTYDTYGDQVTQTDAQGDVTKFGYDTARGWLTSTVTPNGVAAGVAPGCTPPAKGCTTYGHDAWGHTTLTVDPLNHRTSSVYDAEGNVTRTTDGNGNLTVTSYDYADEPTQVKRADNTLTKTTYNADGSVHTVVDGAGNTTTYDYDGQGRRKSRTDAANRTLTAALDPTGRVKTITDQSGRTATYGYDPAGNVVSIANSDAVTGNYTATYDADGRRSKMTDKTGTSTWTYDDFGQVLSQTNGAGSTVGYAYDAAGNRTSIVYPGTTGHPVTRGYDKANRLTSVKDWNSANTTFGYDGDSNLTLTTYPNGTTVTRAPDNADELSSTTLKKGTTTLAAVSYPRDSAGQVGGETPSGVPGSTQTYGYTALQQVKTSTVAGTATSFGYDAADNPTRLATSTQMFDPADQLCWSTTGTAPATPACASPPTGSTVYTYSPQGQRAKAVTGSVTATLGYDQDSRLTSYSKGTTSATYAYDGAGWRASKTVGSVTTPFTSDSDQNLLYDGTTSYVYGPGGVPVEQIGASTQWYFSDQLGSTRALTDATGAVVGGYGYTPYGALASHTGTVATPLQFAGQYTDAETGFQYLRARYYDPATAQFLTVDPAVERTLSPYGYVFGNPLNDSDPTGLCGFSCFLGIGATAGAVAGGIACYIAEPCGLGLTAGLAAGAAGGGGAFALGGGGAVLVVGGSGAAAIGGGAIAGGAATAGGYLWANAANDSGGGGTTGGEEEHECSDAAYQGAQHIQAEVEGGAANHAIPGVDMENTTSVETYLDDVMSSPGTPLKAGQESWYDTEKGYMVLRKNSYSSTGRQMTQSQYDDFVKARAQ